MVAITLITQPSGAFDLIPGNTPDFPGFIDRTFQGDIPQGTKLGIRWFPGLTASQYYLPGSITLAGGQSYGQFTRQADHNGDNGGLLTLYDPNVANEYSGLKNGGPSLWIAPASGGTIGLDPFATATYGGVDPATVGQANLTVQPTPEPATMGLALFGAAGLLTLRRRR